MTAPAITKSGLFKRNKTKLAEAPPPLAVVEDESEYLPDPMDELIRESIASHEGELVAGVLAEKLVVKLRRSDPELLNEWLYGHAAALLSDRIRYFIRQDRGKVVRRTRSVVFGEAAKKFEEEGDSSFLLDQFFVVSNDYVQKRLSEMNRDDCKFVADKYNKTAQNSAMMGAFFSALTKKVTGSKTVGDVFSEDKLESLLRSINPDATF